MDNRETGAKSDSWIVAKIRSLFGGTSMDREQIIQNLQDADLGFTAESLEKIDCNVLDWMQTHLSDEVQPEVTDEEAKVVDTEVTEEVVETETDTDNADETEITVNEYLKTNGVDLEEVLKFMQERKELLDSLIGNEKCGITDEALGLMETCVLKELASEYKPGSYLGVAVPSKPVSDVHVAPSIILKTNKEGE